MPRKIVQLQFNVNYNNFNAGEISGYEESTAKRILALEANIPGGVGVTVRGPVAKKVGEVWIEGGGKIVDAPKVEQKELPLILNAALENAEDDHEEVEEIEKPEKRHGFIRRRKTI